MGLMLTQQTVLTSPDGPCNFPLTCLWGHEMSKASPYLPCGLVSNKLQKNGREVATSLVVFYNGI